MVELIGFGTMVALVWLIAWSMAGESESEKRRQSSSTISAENADALAPGRRSRHAA
jgi:hypothetical protein